MEAQRVTTGKRFKLYDALGGDKEDTGERYILAHVDSNKVCLINLIDGNRWNNSVEVENVFDVTEEELAEIFGDDPFTEFHLIT